MDLFSLLMLGLGATISLGMVLFVFAGPSPQRAQTRRIAAMRERHGRQRRRRRCADAADRGGA